MSENSLIKNKNGSRRLSAIALLIAGVGLKEPASAADGQERLVFPSAKSLAEESEAERQRYVRDFGDDSPGPHARSYGSLAPWEHTYHHVGFMPFSENLIAEQNIVSANTVVPESDLVRIDIRLDRLKVYDYPGKGIHTILFTFGAENMVAGGAPEQASFSQTYVAQEGEGAGVTGKLVFSGLNVSKQGAFFKGATINVENGGDKSALAFMTNGVATRGLALLTTAQPVVAPFVELTKGLAEMFLRRNENRKVQDFYLGLDFDKGAPFGARLREGNYIVVQAPEEQFNFGEWRYKTADGRIVKSGSTNSIPFNYVVFRVSRHRE